MFYAIIQSVIKRFSHDLNLFCNKVFLFTMLPLMFLSNVAQLFSWLSDILVVLYKNLPEFSITQFYCGLLLSLCLAGDRGSTVVKMLCCK